MAADRPEPQPTTTATLDIPIREDMATFRVSRVQRRIETVFADSLLPRMCPVCARSGDVAPNAPLPRPADRRLPGLHGRCAPILVAVVAAPIAAHEGVSVGEGILIVGIAGLAGVFAVLARMTAYTVFRRPAGACSPSSSATSTRCAIANWNFPSEKIFLVLFVLLLVVNIFFSIPLGLCLAAGTEESPWRLAPIVFVSLSLLVLAIVAHTSVRRKVRRFRGLTPKLLPGGNWLKLTCQNLDFARSVELHQRNASQ